MGRNGAAVLQHETENNRVSCTRRARDGMSDRMIASSDEHLLSCIRSSDLHTKDNQQMIMRVRGSTSAGASPAFVSKFLCCCSPFPLDI